jgi:ribonuclease D
MELINTEEGLASVVEKGIAAGAVALDTEFVWEKTYYPILGLIQVGYPDGSADLIDGVAIKDLSALGPLLSDANTVKILHDAVQDLVILTRVSKAFPKNILDTQRAAGFIGLGSTISLSELLKKVLSIRIEKSETKSDWVARPLSESQIKYAKEDVCYGVDLMNAILKRADALNYKQWVLQEMEMYENEALYKEKDPFLISPKVKNSGAINYKQKTLLRSICIWRESSARKQNLPRTFVLPDEIVMRLVKSPPKSIDALKKMNLGKRFLRKFSTSLWEAINRGMNEELAPLENKFSNFEKEEALEAQVDLALAFIKGLSLNTKIDSSLIANRAKVTSFVYANSQDEASLGDHPLSQDWRNEFCGEHLSKLLKGEGVIRVDTKSKIPTYSDK